MVNLIDPIWGHGDIANVVRAGYPCRIGMDKWGIGVMEARQPVELLAGVRTPYTSILATTLAVALHGAI